MPSVARQNQLVLGGREASPAIGRWDITIAKDGKEIPSWLEVELSGNSTLVGRFVYAFGSARPVAEIKFTQNKYAFSIPPQWEQGNSDMQFEFTVSGDFLTGTMVYTGWKTYNWTGVRAPLLKEAGQGPSLGKTDVLI